MNNDIVRIAIDGPSGAGKSTIAKLVAEKLGFDYIDTGAMYRAVGYKLLRDGVDMNDADALAAMLENTDIDFSGGDVYLDGEVISGLIRTPEISKMASDCSAIGAVREKLVALQRGMGEHKSIIMDGRDIGTNVLKDAEYKFYMTATAEERAMRRFKELIEKGEDVEYDTVLEDIRRRDYNDMHRELNPLCKADDAIEIDTTKMNIDEVVDYILREIR